MMHMFDYWEYGGKEWRSGPSGLCSSFVHHGQHTPEKVERMALYETIPKHAGGIILRPGAAPMACGSRDSCGDTEDSWCSTPVVSDFLKKCLTPSGWRCMVPYGGDMGCDWRPADLGKWIEIQTVWQRSYHYGAYERNEFIVSSAAWNAALPRVIDAIFINIAPLRGGSDALSRRVHRDLLLEYPALSEADIPLVAFDPRNWTIPFSLP